MSEQTINQTPDEQIRAVLNTTISLEEDFLTLGELLYKIRQANIYRIKGFEKFGEFVESEYSISGSFAGKMANIYEDFVIILDKDGNELSEIGMEKLYLLRSIMKLLDGKGALEEWYQKAKEKTLFEYKLDIKELKEEQKEEDPMGDVIKSWKAYWKDKMEWNVKTLQYYAALYFIKMESDDAKLNDFVIELQALGIKHKEAKEKNQEDQAVRDAVLRFRDTMQDTANNTGCSISLSVDNDTVTFEPREVANAK